MEDKDNNNDINSKETINIFDKNTILFTIALINIFINTQLVTGDFSMLDFTSIIIINILLIVSIFIIFVSLTKKIKTSLVITNSIIFVIALIDYILVEIRKIPLYFSDIFSIRAAINVLDNYNIEFRWYFFVGIILFIINLIIISQINFSNEIERKIKRRYSFIRFNSYNIYMVIYKFNNIF